MPDILAVPGTRFQYAIAAAEDGRLTATIVEADNAIPSLDALTAEDMVQMMAALRHVERELWVRNLRGAAANG